MTKSNFAISIAILLCGIFSVQRLYKLYYNSIPVAEEGECLEIGYGENTMHIKIVQNLTKERKCIVEINKNMYIITSFEELRNERARPAKCQ